MIFLLETKSEVHKIVKRQKGDYSYDDDEDYTDFEASGDEANYDLDTYDDEDDPYDTPVMPSRVIPPLISPSFDDYGNVVSTPVVLSKSALDVLKTSLYIQDDLEGSGQDDFRSTIVATKASTMMTPEATLMPTFTTDLDEDVITDATSPKLPAINQVIFSNFVIFVILVKPFFIYDPGSFCAKETAKICSYSRAVSTDSNPRRDLFRHGRWQHQTIACRHQARGWYTSQDPMVEI